MSSETSTDARPANRGGFEAWQLFTLAGLIGAAIVAFRAGAQPPSARIFLILTIFAAAAIGMAALRMLGPLTGALSRESRMTLGERTRAVLEREKMLALRSIKELEFDRAMGKISEADFEEMGGRLRTRAGRLIQRLDSRADYRVQIEQEIARRMGRAPALATCASCGSGNDADARFCKGCGQRLTA